MASTDEQQNARAWWAERAEKCRLYAQERIGFRQTWSILREMRWGANRPAEFKPQESVTRRVARMIFDRRYSTVGSILQANTAVFAAREYVHALQLSEQDRNGYRLIIYAFFVMVILAGCTWIAQAFNHDLLSSSLGVVDIPFLICYATVVTQTLCFDFHKT